MKPANHWLGGASGVSLLLAALLLCGYFGTFGPTAIRLDAGPPKIRRSYDLLVQRGRVLWWRRTQTPPPLRQTSFAATWAPSARYRFQWHSSFNPPDRRVMWEFDFHSLFIGPGDTGFIVACPIWCLEILCMIAPSLWLRRHCRAGPVGFAVIME